MPFQVGLPRVAFYHVQFPFYASLTISVLASQDLLSFEHRLSSLHLK